MSVRRPALPALVALLLVSAMPALAQEDGIDSGDTAWILTATALVLFMTIPGLSLFYAGLVRTRNVLSVVKQCLEITALWTLLWLAYG
jgi:Amt family ammonium transporter